MGDEEVLSNIAPGVFDHEIDRDLSREFLADPRHHLAVALDASVIVGFASGVHYIHPDKPPELWINEVAVAETHRGTGIGKKLLLELLAIGKLLGCREAWVLTDRSNHPAMRLYASAGGSQAQEDTVMFTFYLDPSGAS
jgi:ribosomal protein S18 acetylase RimI-like enzyme